MGGREGVREEKRVKEKEGGSEGLTKTGGQDKVTES